MKQSSRARRTLSLSFCIFLLLTLLTVFGGCGTAFDDTVYAIVSENNLSSDGFYYSLYENNTAVLTGWKPTDCKLVVPDRVDGYAVTEIGASAFAGFTEINYLSVSPNIRYIRAKAFSDCPNLVYVDLGGGVSEIGDSAFLNCISLREVNGCQSVQRIGNSAFFFCTSLTRFSFGDALEVIEQYAFYDCATLASVSLPQKAVTLGEGAFAYCKGLTSLSLGGVTEIPRDCFIKCEMLPQLVFGDAVKSVSEFAFRGCSNLEAVYLNQKLKTVADDAFYDCPSVRTVAYSGKESAFRKISFGEGNEALTSASISYRTSYSGS